MGSNPAAPTNFKSEIKAIIVPALVDQVTVYISSQFQPENLTDELADRAKSWLHDLFEIAESKIREALDDPSQQGRLIEDASNSIPLIRTRLLKMNRSRLTLASIDGMDRRRLETALGTLWAIAK